MFSIALFSDVQQRLRPIDQDVARTRARPGDGPRWPSLPVSSSGHRAKARRLGRIGVGLGIGALIALSAAMPAFAQSPSGEGCGAATDQAPRAESAPVATDQVPSPESAHAAIALPYDTIDALLEQQILAETDPIELDMLRALQAHARMLEKMDELPGNQ
jgi:hypothetical protein